MSAVRLLIVNPNSTVSMTEAVARAARAAAAPGVEIAARTSRSGPPAIQGPEDGAAAIPGLLEEIRRGRAEAFDAAIVACFDDTGLAEARAAFGGPVLGIGQAAFHAAALLGGRFSVVTTLAVSVPVIEANVAACGLGASCARVRASGVPVLALETDPEAPARVAAEIARAQAEDGVSVVALGCAGMADLIAPLRARLGPGAPRLIDGVRAAVRLAPTLVGL